MVSLLNTLINKYIYHEKEVSIISFRYSILLFFYLIFTCLFLIFALIFYVNGYEEFAIIKLIFSIVYMYLFFSFKTKKNYQLNSRLLGFVLVLYSIVAYINSAESQYGFIWTFFVPAIFVFLLSYKIGIKYSTIFFILVLFLGIYDIENMQNQFDNYIAFSIFMCSAIAFLIVCIIIDYSFIQLHERIIKISVTDPLTKLYNRRKIDDFLEKEAFNNLSIAILDIDDFKGINDKYGHQVGDEILKYISDILKNNIRKNDIVGRWGGEEFIIILPNTNIDEANSCINHVKDCISKFKYKDIKKITCSFGISVLNDNIKNIDELIWKADKALYEAKNTGKNKIVIV